MNTAVHLLNSPQNEKFFRKKFVEKIKIRTLCSVIFFSENSAIYDIIQKKREPNRPQMKI